MQHHLELKRAIPLWVLSIIATVLFGPLLVMVVLVSRFPQVGVGHSKLGLVALAWPMLGLLLVVLAYRLGWLRLYGFQLRVEPQRLVLAEGQKLLSVIDLTRPYRLMGVLKDTSAERVGLNVWLEVYVAQGRTRFSFAELWIQPDMEEFASQRRKLIKTLSRFAWVVPEADLRHTVWRFSELRPQMDFSAVAVPVDTFVELLSVLDAHRERNQLLPLLSVARTGKVTLRELRHALAGASS